jgi:hypothetical protein
MLTTIMREIMTNRLHKKGEGENKNQMDYADLGWGEILHGHRHHGAVMLPPYLLHRTISSNIKAPPVVPEMDREIPILAEFLRANQNQSSPLLSGGDRDRGKRSGEN